MVPSDQALRQRRWEPTCGAYVEAYVPFLTYVERIYEAVNKPSNGHAGDLGKEKTRNES